MTYTVTTNLNFKKTMKRQREMLFLKSRFPLII